MFKKRIGITQKTMKHPRYDEMLDCLDARWAVLLTSLNFLPIPLSNLDPSYALAQIKELQLDGVILSGGNTLTAVADESDAPESLSPLRDAYEMSLLQESINIGIPVLGVCRGLQVINLFYGGGLVKAKGHAGQGGHALVDSGVDSGLASETNFIFDCPSEVNSYHDCCVPQDQLGVDLIPLAYDKDGFVEALRHAHNKVLAIMWHPEREVPFLKRDCKLIKDHFER